MSEKPIYKTQDGYQEIVDSYNAILKRWPIEYTEKIVETNYGRTNLIVCGNSNKPPLFLIHGSSSNSTMWIGDVEKLSESYRIYCIDIIGEPGKSEAKRYDFTGSAYSQWLKEILDQLKIDKAIFIGNSMGGWMALKFAIEYPEKVTKLVLLATSGITPAKKSFLFRIIPLLLLGERGLYGINKIVYGREDIPAEALEVSNIIMKNFNPRVDSLPVFTDTLLKRISASLLFIGGEKDALLPTHKTAKRINEIFPDAKTMVIGDNGHVVYGVLDTIMEFLEKNQ